MWMDTTEEGIQKIGQNPSSYETVQLREKFTIITMPFQTSVKGNITLSQLMGGLINEKKTKVGMPNKLPMPFLNY